MSNAESIEDFYQCKLQWLPDNLRKEIGHFNVFGLEPFVGEGAKPVPYSRRDYFKISLIKGNSIVHYADKTIEIKKQALLFANPQVPYNWEGIDNIHGGFFCIFTEAFFHRFGNLKEYAVFQPGGTPVFELTDEQTEQISRVFERMFGELRSDYIHKYDVLRNLVFEIVHSAMRLQPVAGMDQREINASRRISLLFLELLERQFPVEDIRQRLSARSASDFAGQLSVHVNHLNRALKATMRKTTTQIISERILQESKILLKHSPWNVSEIAYALGFTEVTHFNNFFKKHTQLSPTKFRNV
ncbi:helix-turn-helix domain-containing protein [Sinomicrobium sp. M5D2P9]